MPDDVKQIQSPPAKPARKSKLLAVQPETVEPNKPKMLIFGPAGVGKTWAAIEFPNVFYIDTEGGADLAHYREKLKAAGGMYLGPDQGSLDFETVIGQVEALATEPHGFKTIVFDSMTKLFNTAISDEQNRLGDKDAFGASKKAPIRQMVKLLRWINRCDMNSVVIAHERDEWGLDAKGNREVVGKTFDAWEKLAYELHLTLRIYKLGEGNKAARYARVGKSRLTGFPEGTDFPWSYAEFATRYGKDVIEKEVRRVEMATAEQVAEIKSLVEVLNIQPETLGKWFAKFNVDTFDEMDVATITKVINSCKERLPK